MRASPVVLLVLLTSSCGREAAPGEFDGGRNAGENGALPSATNAVEVRRVWAGADVDFLGAPSPDGRYYAHIDNNGDLALRDLTSGQTRRLAGKAPDNTFQFGITTAFSPDGRQVAFVCATHDTGYELRVVGIDGTGERTLFRNDQLTEYLTVHDWSADGKWILLLLSTRDGSNQIALVSTADGTLRVLKSLDWRWPLNLAFSPDGRYIAYDFPPDEDSPDRDLYVLAINEHAETRLTKTPDNERLLGWSPAGDALLLATQRGASDAIWRLPVARGKRAGDATLVRTDAPGVQPIGFSKHAYFYGVTVQDSRVYTATLSEDGVLSPPVPASDLSDGRAIAPAWSPDGLHLAYLIRPVGRVGPTRIRLRSLETGNVREIPAQLGDIRRLSWAPDGTALIAIGTRKGQTGVYRIDLETADVQAIARHASGPFVQVSPVLSPDGKTLYFYQHDKATRGLDIAAVELATGHERVIRPNATDGTVALALSPDGQHLAYVTWDRRALRVIPVTGGEPRIVHSLAPDGFFGQQPVAWTHDSRHILFTAGSPNRTDLKLFRIPAAGGTPELLLRMDGIGHLRVRPDGRQIAFIAGGFLGEIWTMRELQSSANAASPSPN
ncbi:MAG TPA: hypothetical protein VMN60_11295 [Longimicrobiales bacterium]|nr:hypothetical protein [Longimicrobiales bacterium]